MPYFRLLSTNTVKSITSIFIRRNKTKTSHLWTSTLTPASVRTRDKQRLESWVSFGKWHWTLFLSDLDFWATDNSEPGSLQVWRGGGHRGDLGSWRGWIWFAVPLASSGQYTFPQFAGFLIILFLTAAANTEPKFKHPLGPRIWGPALRVVGPLYLPVLGEDAPSSTGSWVPSISLTQRGLA